MFFSYYRFLERIVRMSEQIDRESTIEKLHMLIFMFLLLHKLAFAQIQICESLILRKTEESLLLRNLDSTRKSQNEALLKIC